MDSNRRQKARQVFMEVAELPTTDRPAALARACGDDAALRAEVEALLRAHEGAARFLASPTADAAGDAMPTANFPGNAPTTSGSPREGPGTRIGPYKLLQQIGEGGFGSVFLAQQEQPVQRKVALKIIKLGMDTRQVVARFEQERQALAMMDHPNIAKVLDAGATETGRPFFVMELVKGDPIVDYADKNNLSIHDRLELFAQVCQAVQHAHTKGIIHRDIKPSNVLVSTQDGRPHTKVIDFGIAKATASKLTEKTLFAEHRQLIGTPEYMSPEQAEGSLDIDTRTDVYSLGVLLYELLTGTTPFTSQELRSAAYAEIQRIIREVEPPKPSTRVSQNTDTIAGVAARRHTEPKRLGTTIRGELDWIVMKALEKDRQRRYETANGLAMDIRRYLSGEAIVAAPPSTAYRFSKFIRRHRVMVSAGSAVAAALLIGVVAFAWQAKIASDQRDLAVKARATADEQRDRAVAAEKETAIRAAELKQVSEFQSAMLAGIDRTRAGVLLTSDVLARHSAALAKAGVPEPEKDAHRRTFAAEWQRVNAVDAAVGIIDREILAPAVKAVDKQFKDQPLVQAQLRSVLASLYSTLGKFDAAQPLADQVLATRRHELGEKHPDTLEALLDLGVIHIEQAKHAEAEACFRQALTLGRAALGDDHEISRRAENDLVIILNYRGKDAEAEPYARDVFERNRRILGPDDPTTLQSMNSLAINLGVLGKEAEQAAMLKTIMDTQRRTLGGDHPETLIAIANYSSLAPDAERMGLLREVLDTRRRVLGEEHFETAWAAGMLAGELVGEGKLSEAKALYQDAHAKMRRLRGEDHMNTITMARGLASVLQREGTTAEAETILRAELDKCRRVYGTSVVEASFLLNSLAYLLLDNGRQAEAEPFMRELLEIREANQPDAWSTFSMKSVLGGVLLGQNKPAEAEPLLLDGYKGLKEREATIPSQSKACITDGLERLMKLYEAKGEAAEAAAWRARLEAAKAERAKRIAE